jgi:hypothetical protein
MTTLEVGAKGIAADLFGVVFLLVHIGLYELLKNIGIIISNI